MARTREIKARIRAVSNIQRITRTMQMIATARFQSAAYRVASVRPFSRKIAELVGELSSMSGDVKHPLLQSPAEKTNKHLVLVLTSNRGLCGAYNANILRTAVKEFRRFQEEGQTVVTEVVGKKGMAFMKFTKTPVAQFYKQFSDKVVFADVEAIAETYMRRFESGEFDSIRVVAMAFHSASRQTPVVVQLLPMAKPEPAEGEEVRAASSVGSSFEFSPEPKQLLADLLPLTIKTRLFQLFNEASVSEHVSRMTAMKSATDAAKKIGKALTRKYNRARQAAITTELTEIVSGAASVA